MAFNSFIFWLVFPVIFVIHWALPDIVEIKSQKDGANKSVIRPRNLFLIIVSYLLYANWNPFFTLVLFYVTSLTYCGARFIDYKQLHNRSVVIVVFSLFVLLPLLLFKYYNFINETIWTLLSLCGLRIPLRGLNWAIPVGLSFYTFHALGYLLDVFFQKEVAEKSIVDYVLFVSFFPQIVSGPISKASELLPQIKNKRVFTYSQGVKGLKLLLWGMFLKLVLADRLGLFVDKVVADYGLYSGGTCMLAAVFYSLQIYGDFAGYSLMAIGVAKTMGFDLINNFNRPYFSISITDFWRRWHISLSRWLRDYVYIPMGGSRCSKLRNYWNIFVTFLVSGIWHGANWTFIVWGLVHGLAQIMEKALGLNKKNSKGFVRLLRIAGTFVLVTIAWVFFRMTSMRDAVDFIGHSFTSFGKPEVLSVSNFAIYVIAIAIVLLKETREEFFPMRMRFLENRYIKWAICLMLFCLILLCGALDSGSFIYGSF